MSRYCGSIFVRLIMLCLPRTYCCRCSGMYSMINGITYSLPNSVPGFLVRLPRNLGFVHQGMAKHRCPRLGQRAKIII